MLQRFEKIMEPIGPNDAQIHRSSLVDEMDILLIDAMTEARREHLGKPYNGYTYEIVPDGAGVKHYNLTVHLKDPRPTLNPRNLNEAPQEMFGQVLDPVELERTGFGRSDTRMGLAGPQTVPTGPAAAAGAIPAAPYDQHTDELCKGQSSVPSAVDGKR
jgi:hypothetical protein